MIAQHLLDVFQSKRQFSESVLLEKMSCSTDQVLCMKKNGDQSVVSRKPTCKQRKIHCSMDHFLSSLTTFWERNLANRQALLERLVEGAMG